MLYPVEIIVSKQNLPGRKENGARIYLLVENATWEKLLAGKYRSQYNPAAFLASILAWQNRYDLQLIMCKEETTSTLIYEILKRDLKRAAGTRRI